MSNLKIFTENIGPNALNQIYTLMAQPPFENAKIRIMPDVHVGKGCVEVLLLLWTIKLFLT